MSVVPIPSSSHQWGVRHYIVTASLVVSGRLCEDTLKSTLRRLVEIWPRLGARLIRFPGSGQLFLDIQAREFHEAIRFTRMKVPACLSQEIPVVKPGLQSHFVIEQLQTFQAADCPKSSEEMINRPDVPTLWVHVAEYADVTCIGMTGPHCIYDILGIGEVLRQWCFLINGGSPEDIPPLQSETIVEDLGVAIDDDLRTKRLSTLTIAGLWYMLRFATRLMWTLFKAGGEEVCMVFVPQSFIDDLKARIMQKFKVVVSSNDILTALLAQQTFLTGSRRPTQRVTLVFAANIRSLLPDIIGGSDRARIYLGSAVSYMTTQTHEVRQWQAMALEDIVLEVRSATEAQRTPEQVALSWEQVQEGGKTFIKRGGALSGTVMYAPWDVDQVVVISWTKSEFDQLNFSGAALPDLAEANDGKLLFHGGLGVPSTVSRRTWGIVTGKAMSQQGSIRGYWIDFGYSRRQRSVLEEWAKGLWQFERKREEMQSEGSK